MTEPATAKAKSGVDVAEFASRRTLVLRRFARNRPAMASLVILVLLFIGCYALPPLLPWRPCRRRWTISLRAASWPRLMRGPFPP